MLLLDSQISIRARLIFVTHRDDIPAIPVQQRAPTGGACWRSGGGACGFGLVSRASGGLGSHRPANYVGPSGNGLVERMNAGRKSLRDQGDLENGSFRFQKAVPRTKENAAVERREARRSALWIGSSLPPEGRA